MTRLEKVILLFVLITLSLVFLDGCDNYRATCYSEGQIVYQDAGKNGFPEMCPKHMGPGYWKLPDGRTIKADCECWSR